MGKKRKPGTGCVSELNDHLFEGRYSPIWPDGTQHSRNVYARTREECEEKLKTLITEMNEERKNLKEQLTGIAPPEKLTKKQRKLWDYMRLHPEVTEFSTLAKRTGLARNTVKKHYGVVAAMLGGNRNHGNARTEAKRIDWNPCLCFSCFDIDEICKKLK